MNKSKRIITCLLIMIGLSICLNISAQEREKNWSIVPRVGLNMSNLSDMDFLYGDNKVAKTKTLTDFTIGADYEQWVHPNVSLAIGAHYSRQGCHYKSFAEKYTTNQSNVMHCEGTDNNNIHLQYINIPLTASYHLNDFLAVKAGVQCGVFLSGNWVTEHTEWTETNGITEDFKTTDTNDKLDWMCAKTVWSIPLGVEFSYDHILINVSYAFPVTGFGKKVEIPGASEKEKISKGFNKVWTLSVGYRI